MTKLMNVSICIAMLVIVSMMTAGCIDNSGASNATPIESAVPTAEITVPVASLATPVITAPVIPSNATKLGSIAVNASP